MFKKRCFDKKADTDTLVYFFILELLIAFFVFLLLSAQIFGLQKNTLLERNYFSRDLALLVNAFYAAPGNIDYTYEGNLSKYNFGVGFYPYQVAIYEEKQASGVATPYPFMEDKAMEFEYRKEEKRLIFQGNEQLRFTKEAGTIKADKTENMSAHMSKLVCPQIATKEVISRKKLIVDPGHLAKEGDFGLSSKDFNESDKMLEIAEKLKTLAATKALDAELTRRNSLKTIEERLKFIKEKNPDIVISLHANDKEKLTITSFFASGSRESQEKSQKLACLIANKIIENPELAEFEINTANPMLKQPTGGDVLVEGNISILLEVGSLQSKGFFEKTDAIVIAITEGIEDYYEK